MALETKSVYSSFIDSIGYDADAKVFVVTFQNGNTKEYQGIDEDVAMGIWNAPSIGEALHANIPGFTKRGPRGRNAG